MSDNTNAGVLDGRVPVSSLCLCVHLEDKTASDFLYSHGRLGKDVIAATDIEVGPCDQLIGGPVPE